MSLHFLELQRQPFDTMLLPRLQPPLRAAITSIGRPGPSGTQSSLNEAFAALSIKNAGPVLTFVRHASHQQQGAVNKAKDGPGKRLGAKKSGGEMDTSSFRETQRMMQYILTSQRTICHPGQHYIPPTRLPLVPRRELRHGPGPYHLCHATRLCEVLQRPQDESQAPIHRRDL